MYKLTKLIHQTKKPQSWSKLFKTRSETKKSPKKDIIEVNIKMELNPNIFKEIYPDILFNLMKFMDEESYLNFTSVDERIEDMSLKNTSFLYYLQQYHPIEYQKVLENEKLYMSKVKHIDLKYKYYEIHKLLYPDYYEEVEKSDLTESYEEPDEIYEHSDEEEEL